MGGETTLDAAVTIPMLGELGGVWATSLVLSRTGVDAGGELDRLVAGNPSSSTDKQKEQFVWDISDKKEKKRYRG